MNVRCAKTNKKVSRILIRVLFTIDNRYFGLIRYKIIMYTSLHINILHLCVGRLNEYLQQLFVSIFNFGGHVDNCSITKQTHKDI